MTDWIESVIGNSDGQINGNEWMLPFLMIGIVVVALAIIVPLVYWTAGSATRARWREADRWYAEAQARNRRER